jgi:phosphate uptake regulator
VTPLSPKLYRRRIQVTGRSTFIVSLPKEWVTSLGGGAGSEVEMIPEPDGSLKIRLAGRGGGRGRLVRLLDFRGGLDVASAIRNVISSYIAGYDEVHLLYPPGEEGKASKVREVVENAILGFNVLEEGPGRLVFTAVVDPRSLELWKAFRRASRVAHSMLEDLAVAVERGDRGRLALIVERDNLVDKLYLYIARQLSQALMGRYPLSELGMTSQAEALHMFLAAKSVERVADHAYLIASRASAAGDLGLLRGLTGRLRGAAELFRRSTEAFVRLDTDGAAAVAKDVERMRVELESDAVRAPSDPLYHLALDSVRRIVGYCLDLAEAVIDLAALRELAGGVRREFSAEGAGEEQPHP